MAWRYHGRARVNPTSPEAAGICDRCGFKYSLRDLVGQREWRGPRLMDIRVKVCPKCTDIPFIFNKPIIYPPDPVPVRDPRPQDLSVVGPTITVEQTIPPDPPPDPPVYPSPAPPPLPWPMQASGPQVLSGVPTPPFYVTPLLPDLPPEIEPGGFSEP